MLVERLLKGASFFQLTLRVSVVHDQGTFDMSQGTIKKLVKDRGFGFISTNSGKGDVFFHVSAVADGAFDALQEGQNVEFEIVEG